MRKQTAVQRSVIFMVGIVGVWWAANTIATIASKSVMQGSDDSSVGFTSAFKDMRWMELTILQHLLGAVLAGFWVKVTGKSIWPAHHSRLIYIVALGNVVGNMSTNAAYALITSSTAQVIKACEPLFTFMLALFLYKNDTALDLSTSLSVVIIVAGTGSFLMGDTTFNKWGIIAAMISNMAFPTRNIFLKKLSGIWDNPIQKFTVMSIYSFLLALPIWLVKVVVISRDSAAKLSDTLTSGLFHSTYNLASITVLESVNPVTHAILNIAKRLFVIVANVLYFHVPFSFHMCVSLVVLLIGCYLYQRKTGSKTNHLVLKCVILLSFMVYLLIPSRLLPADNDYSHLSTDSSLGISGDGGRISIAWIYDGPIPDSIIRNIEHVAEQNPEKFLHVYCGTTHCVDAVRKLERNTLIVSEFAIVPTILQDLPLTKWLAQHALVKILAGKEFEDHLQVALSLGILWTYGGFYINPRFRVTGKLSHPGCENHTSAWVSEVHGEAELFSGAYFSKQHPLIHELALLFVREYPTKLYKDTPFKFDFQSRAWSLIKTCPELIGGVKISNRVPQSSLSSVNHFAILSYEKYIGKGLKYINLGDRVQGFPGLGFLPFRDKFLERDMLQKYTSKENVTVFLNAWWGDSAGEWPPPKTVHPIMVSIHLSATLESKWGKHPDYLREKEPIGCRDLDTLNFMAKHHVKAYFSGCITLLMTSPFVNVKRNDKIYLWI